MADYKFVYTVSGVDLSDAQRTKISQGIAAAVTHALVGEAPTALRNESLSLFRIYGGRMVPPDVALEAGGIVAMEDRSV
jgi:ethanolamine ammonia-lyase small subunit